MRTIDGYALHLGTALDARDLRKLYDREIATVVDLAIEEKPAELGRDIIYCRLPLIDGEGNTPATVCLAIAIVQHLLKSQTKTLVACGAGMSRSPAIVAAAMSKIEGCDPDECLERLVHGHPHDVSPLFWSAVRTACRESADGFGSKICQAN